MKKIILTAALIFTANISFSQSIFDKLEDMDDVKSFVLTKDAFELLKKFPDAKSEDMQFFNTAKGLEELKAFSTENTSIISQIENLTKTAIKQQGLTQLMRAKDKDSNVKIYIKATADKEIVSKVLMFIKEKSEKTKRPSSSVVVLTGEINMNELSKIADSYSDKRAKKNQK